PVPAGQDPAPGRSAGSVVEDLFARMRAERAVAVARAHEVLDDEPVPPDSHSEDVDEALRERRDSAVEAVQSQLVRRLKRALQDEQNEALDRLRAGPGPAALATLVPPDEQAARFRQAAPSLMDEAFLAGARFVDPQATPAGGPGGVAAELAAALAGPLRRALEAALAVDDDEDDAAVVDRIGAAYRECRAMRVDRAASDAVVAAFAAGTVAVTAGKLRWVVDDDGAPCADCEDNALADPTPVGDAFPTGQFRPPAHAGCRCLLAPAP
ncbi:MAG: hypothetical protein ACRD1K_09120, partial [Acidimicrobiales bacterium]